MFHRLQLDNSSTLQIIWLICQTKFFKLIDSNVAGLIKRIFYMVHCPNLTWHFGLKQVSGLRFRPISCNYMHSSSIPKLVNFTCRHKELLCGTKDV